MQNQQLKLSSESQFKEDAHYLDQGNSLPNPRSTMPLSKWRGSLTTFDGFTSTRPKFEFKNFGWPEVSGVICSDKPAILLDKKRAEFFIPCPLKEAPLIGKTLEAAERAGQSTIGKMRSKQHVTEAAMLVMDFDGISKSDFMAGLTTIKNDGIGYVAYTTFSHGCAEKPGMRIRLVVPLDRPLFVGEYAAAWHGFDRHYWNGQVANADSSGSRLCQQQGTWCCHPDRIDQANSWASSSGVASADTLIEIGKPPSEPIHLPYAGPISTQSEPPSPSTFTFCSGQKSLLFLKALVNAIDPDCKYDDWLRVLAIIFNETSGRDAGVDLANEWSSQGKKYRGESEIISKSSSFRPDHPNPVGIGSRIKMVTDAGYDWMELVSVAEYQFEAIVDADGEGE